MIQLNLIFLLKKKARLRNKRKLHMWLAFYFCWTNVNAALLQVLCQCTACTTAQRSLSQSPTPLSYSEGSVAARVPGPFPWLSMWATRSSVRIDGGGSSGPGSRGGLPSRSSMAPASMMSSSSSSSGASSSWVLVEVPHFRGRPFLPAAAAEGVRQASASGSRHPTPTCAAPPSQGGCCQRTWAEVPLPHVAQERGLGAAAVLAHFALELLYYHHLHHGLQAL